MAIPTEQTRTESRPTEKTTTPHTQEVLRALARPRLTGSVGAHEVAELIRTRFNAYGYQVHEHPFKFSTWPGRFAVSFAGLFYLAGSAGAASLLNMGHPGVALVILLAMLLVVGGIAALTPPLINMLPLGRVTAANLLAARPDSKPRYIFMAHLDSKSQPVPLAFRGPAMILAAAAWLALFIFALLGLLDPVWLRRDVTTLLTIISIGAGAILVFCWVNNRSPGALDNASGLAVLLGLAEAERHADDIAFLITDAEELGLVGARHMARRLDPVFGIINVDGIDDEGTYYVLEKFGFPARHIAPNLVAALLGAADQLNVPARRRKVPFGLLLDHIPLARRHLPAVTLMHGSLASLRRVHRPADNIDNLRGTGIASTVVLLREALRILRTR